MPKRKMVCQECNKPIFQDKEGKWYHRYLVDSRPEHKIIPISYKDKKGG